MIIDKHSEIAGFDSVPHPSIGFARRVSLPLVVDGEKVSDVQLAKNNAKLMLDSVLTQKPDVVIVYDIFSLEEANALKLISTWGIQVVASVRHASLISVLSDPTLACLHGGLEGSTEGQAGNRRFSSITPRGSQRAKAAGNGLKTIFELCIHLNTPYNWLVYKDVGLAAAAILKNKTFKPIKIDLSKGGKEGEEKKYSPWDEKLLASTDRPENSQFQNTRVPTLSLESSNASMKGMRSRSVPRMRNESLTPGAVQILDNAGIFAPKSDISPLILGQKIENKQPVTADTTGKETSKFKKSARGPLVGGGGVDKKGSLHRRRMGSGSSYDSPIRYISEYEAISEIIEIVRESGDPIMARDIGRRHSIPKKNRRMGWLSSLLTKYPGLFIIHGKGSGKMVKLGDVSVFTKD
mmetsp:Transcript_10886/g.17197  ORF Transcript_10886/g.17197 Transcript_10886/m.17197 type:complete len:408 (-) Transcript_10886:239-1462(-)